MSVQVREERAMMTVGDGEAGQARRRAQAVLGKDGEESWCTLPSQPRRQTPAAVTSSHYVLPLPHKGATRDRFSLIIARLGCAPSSAQS